MFLDICAEPYFLHINDLLVFTSFFLLLLLLITELTVVHNTTYRRGCLWGDLYEIEILFVSQYKEMVFDAYAVRHAAFIPAPIEAQYFYQGMERAVKNLERRHKAYLTLSSRGIISRIDLDDILYMESNLKQLCVHTRRGAQEFPRQLESVKPLLDHRFVQCHKSFIVNMDHVADLDIAAMCMNLSTGGVVPVSSRKLKETRDAFLNYSTESADDE